jgi:gas vesicle protein
MSSGKVLLGLLAGVAAGATLGILFAPDKGSSTRRKISQKGDDYADELGQKFNEFIGGITAKFEDLREEAARMVEKGVAKVEAATFEDQK